MLIEQQKGMQRIPEEWGPYSQTAQKGELTRVVSLGGGVCVIVVVLMGQLWAHL